MPRRAAQAGVAHPALASAPQQGVTVTHLKFTSWSQLPPHCVDSWVSARCCCLAASGLKWVCVGCVGVCMWGVSRAVLAPWTKGLRGSHLTMHGVIL